MVGRMDCPSWKYRVVLSVGRDFRDLEWEVSMAKQRGIMCKTSLSNVKRWVSHSRRAGWSCRG